MPATPYTNLLADLKRTVRSARTEAIRQVNRSLIAMYWEMGRQIVASQEEHGWGSGTIKELSNDLRREFPLEKGFAPRNLERMRKLYLTYKDFPNASQLVTEIPWGHNVVLLQEKFTNDQRLFYAQKAAQIGWTRTVLNHHIEARLYERTRLEQRTDNFDKTLPKNMLEQANEAIRSSYSLEFLGVEKEISEADMESRLIARIRDFLLELGYGFSFVGRQHRIRVSNTDFWVDLLFYHRQLQCLIAIDLKVTGFKPEYAGKMNFYLNVLDDQVRLPHENRSIGIILCKEKDDIIVDYSLTGHTAPIGVSEYRMYNALPPDIRDVLPSPQQLREQLNREEE